MHDLDENYQLNEMNLKDKVFLLMFLKNYCIKYRDSLGLNLDMTFGIEIECRVSADDTYIARQNIPFTMVPEGSAGPNGWEFVSPIFHDNMDTWQEVKKTCTDLKDFATTNNFCGGHIHYGAHVFEDNYKYLLNFIFIWMAYEDIIYRFGNGEMLNTRRSADSYAIPVINRFKDLFFSQDMPKNLRKFLRNFKTGSLELGLNFYHYYAYYNHEMDTKNTVEIRCPNGSLEETIWQNNVNCFGKIIQRSLSDDLDLTRLYYNIDSLACQDSEILARYSKINLDKALEFADLIFDNNLDKLNFLKQYIKDGKEADGNVLVKSKRFWK